MLLSGYLFSLQQYGGSRSQQTTLERGLIGEKRRTLYVAQTMHPWSSSISMPKTRPYCQVVLKAVQMHRIPCPSISAYNAISFFFFKALVIDFHFAMNIVTNLDRLEKL